MYRVNEISKVSYNDDLTNILDIGSYLNNGEDYCISFSPSAGGEMEFKFLRETFIANSGTNVVLDNSYCSTVDFGILSAQYALNSDQLFCEGKTYSKETIYVDGDKESVISRIKRISVNDASITNYSFIGSEFDFRPVKLAIEIGGIIYTASYHEATNAYYYNIPFIYFIQKNQKEKIEKIGFENFKSEFMRKITKSDNKIINVQHYGNFKNY